jgi:O-acetyl-ADP-ribose deacetylase (regulator of RNase III)
VTTGKGAYDLSDASEQHGKPIAERPVDDLAGFGWSVDVTSSAPETGGPSSGKDGGKDKTGLASFHRVPLKVPGVETQYTDYLWGIGPAKHGSKDHGPFDRAKLDPTIGGSDQVGLVNAANPGLRGGGGIDGAILGEEGKGNRDAEVDGIEKARSRKGADVGEAIAAPGGNLQKKGISAVIHTVGPQIGNPDPDKALQTCVRNILVEAEKLKLSVIVFCNISSDLYGLAPERTGSVIQAEVERLLAGRGPFDWMPRKIIFNNFPREIALPKPALGKDSGNGPPPPGSGDHGDKGGKRGPGDDPSPGGPSGKPSGGGKALKSKPSGVDDLPAHRIVRYLFARDCENFAFALELAGLRPTTAGWIDEDTMRMSDEQLAAILLAAFSIDREEMLAWEERNAASEIVVMHVGAPIGVADLSPARIVRYLHARDFENFEFALERAGLRRLPAGWFDGKGTLQSIERLAEILLDAFAIDRAEMLAWEKRNPL